MYLSIPAGTTSKIIQVQIFDSSSTIGAMLAGLVYNSVGLTAYYNREGAAGAATAITLVTATKGTWTSSGFVAVDGTNTPGWYELHVPDAALAAGAKSVSIHLKGATNMVPVPILVELTAVSNQDAVRGGMTALPSSGTLAVNPVLAATQTGVTIPTVTTVTNAPTNMAKDSTVAKEATVASLPTLAGIEASNVLYMSTTSGKNKIDADTIALEGSLKKYVGQAATQAAGIHLKGIKNWKLLSQFDVTYSGTLTEDSAILLYKCNWGTAPDTWVDLDGGDPFDEHTDTLLGTLSSTGFTPDVGLGATTYGDFLFVRMYDQQGGTPGTITAGTLTITVETRNGHETMQIELPFLETSNEGYFVGADGGLYRTCGNYLTPVFMLPLTGGGGGGADPWATALPGTYGPGTAGQIIGDNIDAPISGAGGSPTDYSGAVTGAATVTTLIDSGLTQTSAAHWTGKELIFTSGALKYQSTIITGFDPATDKLTFSATTGAPGLGDTYIIGGKIPAVVQALAGTITTTYALSSQSLRTVRGDSYRLTFALGSDLTGWDAYFGMRKAGRTTILIGPTICTWTDVATGSGYIDVTAAQNVNLGTMEGEIELRKGDERHTALKVAITVIDDVVKI